MKKVFCIVTTDYPQWQQILPQEFENLSPSEFSILLTQGEVRIPEPYIKNVYQMAQESEKVSSDSLSNQTMSYQEFLEQVFKADLALVL